MLPWILALVIVLVVAAACRFAEEHPRPDDPPDSGDDECGPGLAILPAAA